MSFIIAVYVGEGMVLASDSRTTYSNTQTVNGQTIQTIGIHTTNTTDKSFLCHNGCGLATCGEATLGGLPITGKIQSFIREKIRPETGVMEMPAILLDYFQQFPNLPNASFIIAGYHKEGEKSLQKIFKVGLKDKSVEQIDTQYQGATWNGETITLTKLLQPVAVKRPDGTYQDLPIYNILWNYFTLQDAIDFAKFAVETTIHTMRFQNVVETVGEPIDVMVIQPEKTYWVSKKEIS
ncbi:MAG: hypothetical protein FWC62_03025 [Firmicutes bacterium]|nr:hypothetical protein [Bacillota bacterium]